VQTAFGLLVAIGEIAEKAETRRGHTRVTARGKGEAGESRLIKPDYWKSPVDPLDVSLELEKAGKLRQANKEDQNQTVLLGKPCRPS